MENMSKFPSTILIVRNYFVNLKKLFFLDGVYEHISGSQSFFLLGTQKSQTKVGFYEVFPILLGPWLTSLLI